MLVVMLIAIGMLRVGSCKREDEGEEEVYLCMRVIPVKLSVLHLTMMFRC